MHCHNPWKSPYTQFDTVCKNDRFDLTSTVGPMVAHRSVFTLVLLLAARLPRSAAQPAPDAAPLSVEDIVKLSKEGFSEDVLITKIKKNGKAFDLSPDELVELKKLGVTDSVIKLLLDPSQPYVPPPRRPQPPPPAPKPSRPRQEVSRRSVRFARYRPNPACTGFTETRPVQMDIKLFMGQKQGAGLGKVLLKKGKVVAYLAGSAAKTRLDGRGAGILHANGGRERDRRGCAGGPRPEERSPGTRYGSARTKTRAESRHDSAIRFTRSRRRFISTYSGDPRQRRVYVFSDWYRRTSQGKLWQGIRFRHGTSRRGKEALAVRASRSGPIRAI